MATKNKSFIVFMDNDSEFNEMDGKSLEAVMPRVRNDALSEIENNDIDFVVVEVYQLVKKVKFLRKVITEAKNMAI